MKSTLTYLEANLFGDFNHLQTPTWPTAMRNRITSIPNENIIRDS